KKPTFAKIRPGLGLGYRRNKTAGAWVARYSDGCGGNVTEGLGAADDYDDANGTTVLSFEQAQDAALTRYRARTGQATAKPTRVAEALERYERDLLARGGELRNVSRARLHRGTRSPGGRYHRCAPTSCSVGGIA